MAERPSYIEGVYPPPCAGKCNVLDTTDPLTKEALADIGWVLSRNCKGPDIGQVSTADVYPERVGTVVVCQNPRVAKAANRAVDIAYLLECTHSENPPATK